MGRRFSFLRLNLSRVTLELKATNEDHAVSVRTYFGPGAKLTGPDCSGVTQADNRGNHEIIVLGPDVYGGSG